MSVWGARKPNTPVGYKELKSSEIIDTQIMDEALKRRTTIVLCLLSAFPRDICRDILRRTSSHIVGLGRSRYARRRRALQIGRCERCYRVYPPVCGSKCDNKTCWPGLSINTNVANHIDHGVTEVIPWISPHRGQFYLRPK
ncbi:16kDa protein [Lily symptomless virus]|uniref:RNA silencing suppressor n=1 Tax=Lily symptomless virus TaxID=12173 RepID=Q70WL2_LSV|nr:16kDa protein [Lily symptomless virus]CAD56795.1 16kDa protein [Lily symptomless virus]